MCVCVYQSDELQLVRDALRSLRNSFSGIDSQHHTLDTLERGLASMMERLHVTDSKKRQERKACDNTTPDLLSMSTICLIKHSSATCATQFHFSSIQGTTKSPGRRANYTDRESWPLSSSEPLQTD